LKSALLIVLIVFLYSFQTLFCAKYSDNYSGKSENTSAVFCVLEGLFLCLFTLAWIGFKFELSPTTALFGMLNGFLLFGYNTSLIKANARGSYAFMNVVMLFGIILIPLLYSTLICGDRLQWYQLAAIALMLISFVLMNLHEIRLKGAPVKATDLRAGAAMVVAGLMASGVTDISGVDYILRGYQDIDKKLNSIGAQIERLEV